MKLVIDASTALAWIFTRTSLEERKCANNALSSIEHTESFVPSLWHTEITNALLVAERRKIISEADALDYLSRLSKLTIITDDTPPQERREILFAIGREYTLTAYDALYLELALRKNARLATFDKKLAQAMLQTGGKIFT